MGYLGTPASVGFSRTTKDRFSGDNSTTGFTMSQAASTATDIQVFVDNIRQEPTIAYSTSGATLTFTEAPPTGTNNVYVIHQHQALGTGPLPPQDLGSTDYIFGDDISFNSDGAVINFGLDSEVNLTHVHNTGLILNSTNQLQFGDSGTHISQSADGVLDLVSDTEIEINATTIDMNGNVDISGTLTVGGALDFSEANISNVGELGLDKIFGDSDTNTDITFAGSDVITVTTGGTERIRIDADGSLLKGVTSAQTNSGVVPRFQIEGTSSNESTFSIVRNSNDDNAPSIRIGKTRGTSVGSNTTVSNDDFIGLIRFFAADGTDRDNDVASIFCQIDAATGSNDTPGKLTFNVAADGTNSSSLSMMIEEDGHVTIGQSDNQGSNRLLVSDDDNHTTFMVRSTNGSFTERTIYAGSNRASSSAFILMDLFANNTSDTIFRVRGDGEVGADGSFSGGGVDYAEYFEWKDGNSSNEDRVGLTVKLDGNKIVLSSDSDNASDILGVISGKPAVEGGAADLKWNSKFLVDDFNRYIWEEYTATVWTEVKTNSIGVKSENHIMYESDRIPSDVTVPSDAKVVSVDDKGAKLMRRKLNPDYDESKTYVPRRDREEWDAVGLLGQLRMKKGQKTGTNWIKMRDISDTVEEWLVR